MPPKSYTRKAPQIEVLRFLYGSTEASEVAFWLNSSSTNGDTPYLVQYSQTQPTLVISGNTAELNDFVNLAIAPGEYIVRDSTGKVFKLSEELLNSFYDPIF